MPSRSSYPPGRFPVRRCVGPWAELDVPADLRRWVAAMWSYHTPPGRAVAPHRVIPTAGPVICLVSRTSRSPGPIGGSRSRTRPDPFLLGPVRTVRTYAPEPGLSMEGIELHLGWSRALLGVAPEDHVDAVRPLGDVDVAGAARLVDLASRAATPHARVGVLLTWLRSRIGEMSPDPSTRLAVAALRRLDGRGYNAVRAAAEDLGVSARHLRRCVASVTGEAPKGLQRIHRLNQLVAQADLTGSPRWSSLALAHGYFDQAHLISEVRRLTGSSPGELHAERRRESDTPVRFFQSGSARPL